jgi:hypothetical protein
MPVPYQPSMFSDASAISDSIIRNAVICNIEVPANPFMQYSLKMKYLAGIKIRTRYNTSLIPHDFKSLEN